MKLPSGKHAYEILIVLIVVLMASLYTHAQEPEAESVASSTTSATTTEDQASSTPLDIAPPAEAPANIRAEHRAQLERTVSR
jgi:hypothetical protein